MRTILSSTFLLFFAFSALAQDKRNGGNRDRDDWHKQIDAIHVAFITDRLKLNPEDAQKFWPVYNNYQREMDVLNDQRWKNRETNSDNPEKALNVDLMLDQKVLDTKKRYQAAFQRVVSAQKVLALYIAEKDFREYLMKQLHSRDDRKDDRK